MHRRGGENLGGLGTTTAKLWLEMSDLRLSQDSELHLGIRAITSSNPRPPEPESPLSVPGSGLD